MLHDRDIRPAGRVVTATYFVRNFADLKREADRAPVFIESHGKAGWALVSNGYIAAREAAADVQRFDATAALFDLLGALAALIDADQTVVWINAAMARHIGASNLDGVSFHEIAGLFAAPHLAAAAQRVARTGQPESFDVDSRVLPGRVFRATVARLGDMVGFVAEDVTDALVEQQREATATGLQSALDTLPGLARGTINVRGVIDGVQPSLVELVGTVENALMGARLPSLFDVRSRVVVADAVEGVLSEGEARSVSGDLLIGGSQLRHAELSLAPLSSRGRVIGAAFLIQAA